MKALVYHGPGQRAGIKSRSPRSSSRPTRSSASTPPRSAAPTSTSSKATSRRPSRGPSSGTRRSAPSRRSARASKPSRPATGCCCRASPPAARCRYCKEGRYGQCLGGGGWIFGYKINGVRPSTPGCRSPTTPSTGPRRVTDEQVLLLADILPTGTRSASQRHGLARRRRRDRRRRPDRSVRDHDGAALQPGHIVAIDLADARLEAAKAVRRRHHGQQRSRGSRRAIMDLTDGSRRRRRIEAVGVPATFELRRSSSVPVDGSPTSASTASRPPAPGGPLDPDVTITTGLVDTYSTPTLLRLCPCAPARPGALRHAPLPDEMSSWRLRRVRATPPTPARSRSSSTAPRARARLRSSSLRPSRAESCSLIRPVRGGCPRTGHPRSNTSTSTTSFSVKSDRHIAAQSGSGRSRQPSPAPVFRNDA